MPRQTPVSAQLDLFMPAEAQLPPQEVGCAAVSSTLAAIAQHLPACLHFGTSSWAFPGWEGIVYDRPRAQRQLAQHGLAAYAQHPLLRSVGIDRTYYAPITAGDFAAYAAAVPEDFRFLVKAHELCTLHTFTRHGRYAQRQGERNVRFLDPAYVIEQVVGPYVEGLAHQAGPLLFQFPPQDMRLVGGAEQFAERLHAFLHALPQGVLYAVELRNAALLTPAYVAALRDVGACHCFNVHPSMPSIQEQQQRLAATAPPACVIRWMLHPTQRYDAAKTRYQPFNRLIDEDPSSRRTIVAMCLEAAAAGRPAFVIANNKAEGSAPLTLFRLAEHLAEQR